MALPVRRLATARPAGTGRFRAQLRPLDALLIGVAVAALVAVAARFLVAPLDRFDEGLTLTKAALQAGGLVPYRDFWMTYGPLDTLVLGTAFHVIAVDALIERILAIAGTLLFVGSAYALMSLIGARGALRLLMTSLFAMIPLAIPAFNSPILADALLLGAFSTFLRGQADVHRHWAVLTGALTALASFARPELGAALVVGLLAGYAVPALSQRRVSPLVTYIGGASLGLVLLWGPVFLIAGPAPIFLQLVQSTLTVYSRARSIPIGQGHEGPVVAVMAGAFALTWAWAVVVLARRRLAPPEAAAAVAFLLSGSLLFAWVWTRADGAHTLTAWPATGALLVLLMQHRRRGLPLVPRIEATLSVVAAVFVLVAAGGLALRDLGQPGRPGLVPRATLVGARAWIPARQLAALLHRIDELAPAGHPIYVGLQRNDLVVFNDTMLYFLAGRRPGTVYFEDLPGFTNQEAVEQTIICQLVRSHVTLAVLGPNTPGEPWNLSSRPGSPRLDAWLQEHAITRESADPYQVITLRQDPTVPKSCPGP